MKRQLAEDIGKGERTRYKLVSLVKFQLGKGPVNPLFHRRSLSIANKIFSVYMSNIGRRGMTGETMGLKSRKGTRGENKRGRKKREYKNSSLFNEPRFHGKVPTNPQPFNRLAHQP